jgi:septum formation protein
VVTTIVPRLVLASASPRRKEMLEAIGLRPEIVPAEIDESRRDDEEPIAYARRLAGEKAQAVAATRAGRPVLGADTIVCVEETVLGKPRDAEDARAMLQRLANRSHRVITAYQIVLGAAARGRAVETEVRFRALSPAELEGYIGSREWDGKAGGYAIQGIAGAFVRSVHGSYTNVVGLPLCEVVEDLAAIGALPADWALGQ